MAAVTVGLKRIPLHRAHRTILYTNYSIIVSKTIKEPQWLKMAASEGTPQISQLDTTVVLDLHSRLLDRDRSTAPWQRTLCAHQVDWIWVTEPPAVSQALTQIVGPQKLLE